MKPQGLEEGLFVGTANGHLGTAKLYHVAIDGLYFFMGEWT